MTRVDAHLHFWRHDPRDFPWMGNGMEALRRDFLPEQIEPQLEAAGFDSAIAVQARADEAENAFLLDLADTHPWIAGVVGWVDLRAEDAGERLARWRRHPRFAGVRHLLQDDPDVAATVADAGFVRGVAAAQQQGLVYEVLVRGPAQLAAVTGFCAARQRHLLVLDHLGKPEIGGDSGSAWRGAIRRLGALPHVYCKLSGLVTEDVGAQSRDDAIRRHLDVALEAFGAERLMFGSDWPVCLLRAGHAEVAAIVRDWAARLSADEQAQLWGGTAMRCYGLRT